MFKQSTRQGKKINKKTQKTKSKMAGISLNLLIITLNVNALNTSIIRQRLAE